MIIGFISSPLPLGRLIVSLFTVKISKNFEYDSIRQTVENVKGKGYNYNKLLLSYSIMNKYKLAIGLALLTAVFSGVNNFITKIAVTAVKDRINHRHYYCLEKTKRTKNSDSQAKKALDSYRYYWRQHSFYSVFYRLKTYISAKRLSNS